MEPGGSTLGPELSLAIFAIPSLALAALLLLAARPRGGATWQIAARTALPVVLLLGLMLAALWHGAGTRLTATLSAFHFPAASAPSGSRPELMFRVGDRSDSADLIVRPYLKSHLNRIFDGDPPRAFIAVEAARSPADPAALQVQVQMHDYPGIPAEDLPGMRVTMGEDTPCDVQSAATRLRPVKPGETIKINIFRDDNEGRCGARQTRFKLRRSLIVEHVAATPRQQARIDIRLPQSEVLRTDAGTCLNPRDVLLPSAGEAALPPGYLMPRNLEFSALGAGGHDRAVLSGAAIGPAAEAVKRCDKSDQTVTWPAGDTANRASLTLGFVFLTLPWLPLWLLVSMAGATFVLGREAQRHSLAERVLVPSLLYLLALRSMVAIASTVYDASLDPNIAYRDAALATAVLPPALIALIRPANLAGQADWLRWLGLTVALVVVTMIWFWSAALERDQWALLLAVLGLLSLRALVPTVQPVGWLWERLVREGPDQALDQRLLQRIRHWPAPVVAAVRWALGIWRGLRGLAWSGLVRVLNWTRPSAAQPIKHALGGGGLALLGAALWATSRADLVRGHIVLAAPLTVAAVVLVALGAIVILRQILPAALLSQSRPFNVGVLLLALLGMVRLVLIGLGWQERIMEIVPIAIFYLPLVFAGSALIAVGLLRFESYLKWGCVVAIGAIAFAGVIAPHYAGDNGFFLIHLAPILVVALYLARRSAAPPGRRLYSGAALIMPLILLVVGITALTASTARDVPSDEASIAETMNRAIDFDANGLRLLQIARPSAVELIGTRSGFDQMEQTAILHSLTNSLTGAGWLAPVELLSIRKEQAWDYVGAVHLMYPFGRVGAVCFLLVMIAAAAALNRPLLGGQRVPPGTPSRLLVPRLVGSMALLTLPFCAAYMLLGNLLIVPFTGLDIYLLASRSTGDLLEGLLVLALMALAVREVEP